MKKYNLLNNIFGWIAFVISAIVYIMTAEPTASFWDCPEFITSAFKLEVGHPPGNTFFNLTGRFFANFAGGDVTKVAFTINCMSALLSAGTILFLFWTITHLLKKIVCKSLPGINGEDSITSSQIVTILGGGLVGSLIYTFTDTFWFSAVEGEVYAFSSFMTALVFWLILKWESQADQPNSDRYIILIAYIIGLSIGVHLLNLLTIPALVLVYYFKKRPDASLLGSIIALGVSVVGIALILYGLVPGFVKLCGYCELLFVNVLGFKYNSGTLFYFFFVLAVLAWGLFETWRAKSALRMRIAFCAGVCLIGIPFLGGGWLLGVFLSAIIVALVFLLWKNLNIKLMNTVILSLMMILIGYSTFAQIIIRSVANTPMDQNSPDEIFSFMKYLNREQYGDRPLFYGYTFVSDIERDNKGKVIMKKGEPIYAKAVKNTPEEKDRYVVTGYRENYVYTPELNMLMPRMYSKQDSHIQGYKYWTNFTGKPVRVFQNGENQIVMKPTFMENIKFFFNYQLNHMYWRYFMWNFSGRQNDIQGYGDITKGNWITGFNFIDRFLVGNQSDLPADMKDNKGRNAYYMLPLILGIIGLIYQARSGRTGAQGFWIVLLLFFMTGIAIVIYLNQTPYQPRERDYAYAASFYAYAIWTGFGVAALIEYFNKKTKNHDAVAWVISIASLAIPAQMAAQNWDDHDRSDRYTARDFGYNYLTSVEQDGIIFTNGDNDTFPLWYAQEVEGYRTDVRVCNLSYLQTDWYIDQMKSPAYDSKPLPIALKPSQYNQAKLNYAYVMRMGKDSLSLTTALNWLASEDERTKRIQGYNERIDFIPAEYLYINIDSATVAKSPVMQGIDTENIVDQMTISLKNKNIVTKNEIAILYMLDGISKEGWQRPIYYATTVGSDMYMNMAPYFNLVGLAYQITPTKNGPEGTVNTEVMYDNMMNKFLWGGIENPKVYLDETNRRMCRTLRLMFVRLVDALIEEGKDEKAINALNFCMKQIPGESVPHDYTSISLGQDYIRLNQTEKGVDLLNHIADKSVDNLKWMFGLPPRLFGTVTSDISHNMAVLHNIAQVYKSLGLEQEAAIYENEMRMYNNMWSHKQ